MSFKKYKSQGKAVQVTVNSKEENSLDFCLDFVQEFGLNTCEEEPTQMPAQCKENLPYIP
jgi:hypothetical protein